MTSRADFFKGFAGIGSGPSTCSIYCYTKFAHCKPRAICCSLWASQARFGAVQQQLPMYAWLPNKQHGRMGVLMTVPVGQSDKEKCSTATTSCDGLPAPASRRLCFCQAVGLSDGRDAGAGVATVAAASLLTPGSCSAGLAAGCLAAAARSVLEALRSVHGTTRRPPSSLALWQWLKMAWPTLPMTRPTRTMTSPCDIPRSLSPGRQAVSRHIADLSPQAPGSPRFVSRYLLAKFARCMPKLLRPALGEKPKIPLPVCPVRR